MLRKSVFFIFVIVNDVFSVIAAKVLHFLDMGKRLMDILAKGWTKWHENGQFGRDGRGGTEIATFKVKTFKSDLLKQADYCKAATTPTDRKQRKIV